MAVEEQTQYSGVIKIGWGDWKKAGQKLVVPNREISKLGFWIHKTGNGGVGTVTLGIWRWSDKVLLASKAWGAASGLPSSATYEEVTLDVPLLVNEEVAIGVEDTASDLSNFINVNVEFGDVKADENLFRYSGNWTDDGAYDSAYRYTYEEPLPPGGGGDPAALVAAGVI